MEGVFSLFSIPRAKPCYILSKESIDGQMPIPLSPFVALASFLTNNHLTIDNHPFKNDATFRYLYTLALFQQQMDTINKDTYAVFCLRPSGQRI